MRQSRLQGPHLLLFAGLAVSLISCLQSHRICVVDTDPDGWSTSDETMVVYENTDTLSRRDIRVVVRLCNDFNYDKLALSVTTVAPDGYRWCDTLYIDTDGRLPRVGLYGELEQPYRRGVVLPHKGRYLFSFAPVMPAVSTEGVAAAGIRVEPSGGTTAPVRAVPADSSRLTR